VTVLILDASTEIRARLIAMLSEFGTIDVHEAADAEGLFRMLDSTEIHVVVLDVHLPNELGLHVLRAIRGRRPRIFSIVLTNETSEHHRRECLSSGADFFFDKSRHFERAVNIVCGLASFLPLRGTRAS
jgi:two-component system, NarL family, response regulator DevR